MIGGILAVLLAAAPNEPSRPPTPALALTWDAPAGCPDAEAVRQEIVRLLGRPLGEDPRRTVRVEGSIALRDGQWVLDLRIGDDEGSSARTFSATHCDELLEPAAVVCSLAVDEPMASPEREIVPEAPTEPTPPSTPAAPTSAVPVVPAPRAVAARRARPRRTLAAVLGVRGGIDAGNLPGVGGELEAAVGLAIDRARVELVALHVFERSRDGTMGGRGSFRIFAARPQACWAPTVRRFAFPLCAGIELGALRSRGSNFPSTHERHHLWLAFVPGAGATWSPVRRLALGLRADLVVAPWRREFSLGGAPLFVTGVVGARGLAVVEVRLP